MRLNAEGIPCDVEDLTPKHAFQFEILVSSCEKWVALMLICPIDLIENCIVDYLPKNGFIIGHSSVSLQEVLVATSLLNHVIQYYTHFVAQAFIV